MQYWLVAASGLSVLTGLVHSIMGEALIFRHLRQGGIVPKVAVPPLRSGHVRILWATWHLASIFGFAFAVILLRLGTISSSETSDPAGMLLAIAIANLAAGLLVLIATKGRHPGWVALLLIGIFTAMAV